MGVNIVRIHRVLAQHSLLSAKFRCSTMLKVVQTLHELSLEVGVQRTICTAKVQIRYKSRQISFEMHRNLTVKH